MTLTVMIDGDIYEYHLDKTYQTSILENISLLLRHNNPQLRKVNYIGAILERAGKRTF